MMLNNEGNLLISFSNGFIKSWEHDNTSVECAWFAHKNVLFKIGNSFHSFTE